MPPVKTLQPFAARDYYSDPRRRIKTGLLRLASRASRRVGVDIEARHFYSPIPQIERIKDGFFESESQMPGITPFDTDAHFKFIDDELAGAIAEFSPPRKAPGVRNTYYLDNGLYQGGDADLLYAFIRRFRPGRILELGAGFSTLVSAMACERNRAQGHESSLVTCDPYAIPPAPGEIPGLTELRAVRAEDLPLTAYEGLGEGDILFIDSSHTVKVGGDVTHLFLEVVPRLRDGVLVHVHDVFLPWSYPREWIDHNHWYWAEQYLLQAFLAFNSRARVLVAAYAAHRRQPGRLAEVVPNYRPSAAPLSLWFRIGS